MEVRVTRKKVCGTIGEFLGTLGEIRGNLVEVRGTLKEDRGTLGEVRGTRGEVHRTIGDVRGTLEEVRDWSVDHRGGSRCVKGPSGRSGTGRRTHGDIRDGSGDRLGGPWDPH